jgi:CRISPR/Cas system CSM-associated protein Csm4 (group 5 of RAMP superfamily)
MRIAWDFSLSLQKIIKDKTQLLINAGYSPKDIMIFMICNWKTTYQENLKKMDLCKVWNFQIHDGYFDNQLSPNIKPIHWTSDQIKDFRHKCRKHNHMVNYGFDPEVKERLAEYNAQLKDYWDDMKLEENNAIEQGIADGTYQLYTCIKDIDRYKQGYNYYVYIIPLKNQYQSTGIADISDELAEYISKIQDLIWIVSDNGIGTLKTKSLFSIELRENFNEYFTKL